MASMASKGTLCMSLPFHWVCVLQGAMTVQYCMKFTWLCFVMSLSRSGMRLFDVTAAYCEKSLWAGMRRVQFVTLLIAALIGFGMWSNSSVSVGDGGGDGRPLLPPDEPEGAPTRDRGDGDLWPLSLRRCLCTASSASALASNSLFSSSSSSNSVAAEASGVRSMGRVLRSTLAAGDSCRRDSLVRGCFGAGDREPVRCCSIRSIK